jgi:hypothetical protein
VRGWFGESARHSLAARGIPTYLYHGTSTDRLRMIRKGGLDPFAEPKMWEGMSLNYVYFTLSEEDAQSFSRSTVAEMKELSGEDDIRGVVLRVSRENIENNPDIRGVFELDEAQFDPESGIWFTYDGYIPPYLIEIRGRDGKWRPLV